MTTGQSTSTSSRTTDVYPVAVLGADGGEYVVYFWQGAEIGQLVESVMHLEQSRQWVKAQDGEWGKR